MVVGQNNEVDVARHDGESDKNRMVALLLCLFLGVISGHRFYVGKFGTAILQILLIACFGVGAIWWLIDLVMIIRGSFKDKDNKILSSWQ